MFKNLKNEIPGLSIEMGDTTYNKTLQERIFATKVASFTIYKPMKKQILYKSKHQYKCIYYVDRLNTN